jgi:uncharacterized protein involved in exopolysaccharide biosynthesis
LAVHGAGATQAALAKAAEKALWSSRTIAAAVSALKLDRDPEFSGATTDAFNVAVDLFSANGAATDLVSRAEASLLAAIQTSTDDRAGTIDFTVTTGSTDKSARIATYLASAVTRTNTLAAPTNADNGALKKANDAAQTELVSFTQRSGEGNVKVAIGLQRQIGEIDAELKTADERIVVTKARADRLRTAKAADVLTGMLSPEMMSAALEDRRDKYVAAKASLAKLSASLGPRHPRLLAAQAAADGLSDGIGEELGRLRREADDDAKTAAVTKRQLNDQRNVLIAQSRDTGVDLARLTELRDKAVAARSRLDDSMSTGALPASAAQVVLQKVPQVAAVSSGRGAWFASLLGALAGLALGLAVAAARSRSAKAGPAKVERSAPSLRIEPFGDAPLQMPAVKEMSEMDVVRSKIAAMREGLRTRAITA